METVIKLIPCNWKHQALLAEMGGSTFYETFSPYHSEEDMQAYITKTYNLKTVAANLQDPSIVYYVAYADGLDMGYIKLLENVSQEKLPGRTMELEKIYLRKPAFGSGLATLLMDKAVEVAQAKGYQNLFLGVWQENKRALTFYKKSGFDIFDIRKFKLGDQWCDDYLLNKSLSSAQ